MPVSVSKGSYLSDQRGHPLHNLTSEIFIKMSVFPEMLQLQVKQCFLI